MPDIKGFHHVSLSVTDLDRSARWYADVLGFEAVTTVDGEGFRRTRLRASASGLTLTLTQHEDGRDERFDERRTGLDHVALVVDSDDIEEWKNRFEEHDVDHSEVKSTPAGGTLITLRDPDNIQLEVFATPSG
ncbi:MAG: VOC family protein [Acidimicrobiia bacterium]